MSECKSYDIKPLWVGLFSVSLWLLSPFWIRMLVASKTLNNGLYYENVGKLSDAHDSYITAISIDPTLADSYFACSRLYMRRFKINGAIQDYHSAVSYLTMAYHYQKNVLFLKQLDHDRRMAHE